MSGTRKEPKVIAAQTLRDKKPSCEQPEDLIKRLSDIIASEEADAMRTELQMLEAEIHEIGNMFDAVQEKLQQWKEKAVSRVQAVHDSVARRLRDSAEAEECSKEVSLACDAGDTKKVMELTASKMSRLNEAYERLCTFERSRSELQDRQRRQGASDEHDKVGLRSVGDVAAGVQQLQLVIDRHMADVMQQCWLNEDGELESEAARAPVCRSEFTVDRLGHHPYHVAFCANTSGFVADSLGNVVVAPDSATDGPGVPLPQPCVFVSFGPRRAKHLLVASLDGVGARLRCHCQLDWGRWILGLHCDSQRQLLFVAQADAVTVTDLSGLTARRISASSLNRPPTTLSISDMTCSQQQVMLLDGREREVLTVDKDSGQLVKVISLRAFNIGDLDGLAMHGTKLLLMDWQNERVHRLCCITGQLIVAYAGLNFPWRVAVDDTTGVVFVSERNGNVVTALAACGGATLQTLDGSADDDDGDGGAARFDHPTGLCLVRGQDRQFSALLVCDWGGRRLRVYRLV